MSVCTEDNAKMCVCVCITYVWAVQESCVFSVQLFDAMALEEVYQPLKPAALYEEALFLVREGKVSYRTLR